MNTGMNYLLKFELHALAGKEHPGGASHFGTGQGSGQGIELGIGSHGIVVEKGHGLDRPCRSSVPRCRLSGPRRHVS